MESISGFICIFLIFLYDHFSSVFIIKGKGKGIVALIVNKIEAGKAIFNSSSWDERSIDITLRDEKCIIEIEIVDGEVDLLEFRIE